MFFENVLCNITDKGGRLRNYQILTENNIRIDGDADAGYSIYQKVAICYRSVWRFEEKENDSKNDNMKRITWNMITFKNYYIRYALNTKGSSLKQKSTN